jgi:elongation factor G
MGSVVGDLNRRRGKIEDMGDRGNSKVIKAKVPLSEMFGYVTELRTISSGRATSSMQFSHYEAMPSGVQEEALAKIKGVTA